MVAMFVVVLAAILGGIRSGEVISISDDLYKIEESVRRTTNKLFSNLHLRGIRQQPNIQTFSLVHNYFIALTLQNYNSLKEVAILTRTNKTYIGNDTVFITTFNEIVDEENGLFIAENSLDIDFELNVEMHKLAYLRKYNPDPNKFKDITTGILRVLGKSVRADSKNLRDRSSSKMLETYLFYKRGKHVADKQKTYIDSSLTPDYTDSFGENSATGEIKIFIANFTQTVNTNSILPLNTNKSATGVANNKVIEVNKTTAMTVRNSTSLELAMQNVEVVKEKNDSINSTLIEERKTAVLLEATNTSVVPTKQYVSETENQEINVTSSKNSTIINENEISSLFGMSAHAKQADIEVNQNKTSGESSKIETRTRRQGNDADVAAYSTIRKGKKVLRRSKINSENYRRKISAENDEFFQYSGSTDEDDIRDVANAIEIAPHFASAIQALFQSDNTTVDKIKSYVAMKEQEKMNVTKTDIYRKGNDIASDDLGENSHSSKQEDSEKEKKHKSLTKKSHKQHIKEKQSNELDYENPSYPYLSIPSRQEDTDKKTGTDKEATNTLSSTSTTVTIEETAATDHKHKHKTNKINTKKEEIITTSSTKATVVKEKEFHDTSATCNSSESSVEDYKDEGIALRSGLSIPFDNITHSNLTSRTKKSKLTSLTTFFNTLNDEITVTTSKTTEEASNPNISRRRSRRRNRKPTDYWNPKPGVDLLKEDTRRIFKGKGTKIKKFPFMASIQMFGQFQCGGCIIASDLIITAASCLQLAWNNRYYRENPNFLAVRVGTQYSTGAGELISVFEIHFHPSYQPKTLKNNLAIIRLKRHINFENSKVKMITFDRNDHELPLVTNSIIVLGWGGTQRDTITSPHNEFTSTLKMAVLDIYPYWDCREIYSKEYVTTDNFCAGFVSMGGGACNRDVGGPGIVENVLVGIISFGAPACGTPDAPTVFTKLGYYVEWIEDIMEADSPSQHASTTKKTKKYFATLSAENDDFPWGVTPFVTKAGSAIHAFPVNKKYPPIRTSTKVHMDKKFFYEFLRTVFNSKEIHEYLDVMKDPTAMKTIDPENSALMEHHKGRLRPVPYKIHHTTAERPPSYITIRTPYAIPSPQRTRSPRFFAASSEGNSESECAHDVEEFMATMTVPHTALLESDYGDPTTEKETQNTNSEAEFPSYFDISEDVVVTEGTSPGFRLALEDNTTYYDRDSDIDLHKRIQKLVGSAEVLGEKEGATPQYPELLLEPTEKVNVREALHKTLFNLYLSDNEKKTEFSNEEILPDSDVREKDENTGAEYVDAESVVGLLNKGPLSQDIILDIIKEVIDEAYLKKQPTHVARVALPRRHSTVGPTATEVFRSVDMKKKKK